MVKEGVSGEERDLIFRVLESSISCDGNSDYLGCVWLGKLSASVKGGGKWGLKLKESEAPLMI